MYKQDLYRILPNYVKPKVLKRNNRYKKWSMVIMRNMIL